MEHAARLWTGALLAMGGLVGLVLVGPAAVCAASTQRQVGRLEARLLETAGDRVLAQERGRWNPGSCCVYAVAAIAVVPDGPPPPGARVAVRWKDPAGTEWVTIDGNRDVGTYPLDCHSCGPPQVRSLFTAVSDPGAVVWYLADDVLCET